MWKNEANVYLYLYIIPFKTRNWKDQEKCPFKIPVGVNLRPERGSSSPRYNLEGHPGKQGRVPPPPPGCLFRTEYPPQVPEWSPPEQKEWSWPGAPGLVGYYHLLGGSWIPAPQASPETTAFGAERPQPRWVLMLIWGPGWQPVSKSLGSPSSQKSNCDSPWHWKNYTD